MTAPGPHAVDPHAVAPHAVAIVGLGAVLPESRDLAQFWEHVAAARDLAREVPVGRWPLDPRRAYSAGTGVPDRVYSLRGCFVDDAPLDPAGLDIDPELLARLDPLFHTALAAARDAWNDAQTESLDRARVGVILGNIALPTASACALARDILGRTFAERVLGRDEPARGVHPLNRYVAGLPVGMVATALGLGGEWLGMDAACASSLYAIERAVMELEAGRLDAVLAGGMSRADSLYTQTGFSQLRALSPTGRCAPFDARADGLVVGEGAGVFVLKRLADALAHGDHVYGVIRAVGLSNDVEGNLLAPSSDGQLRAMRAAYARAGWEPSDVDVVECHATGTRLGDATEFETLSRLWEDEARREGGLPPGQRCVIGSVKSNVGHLLTGAGAAGLMKVVLALRAGELPPSANFELASPRVPLDGSPFRVLSAPEPWERRREGAPRRAAVSAFGFGGINAHLLLEEWVPRTPAPEPLAVRAPDDPIAIVGVGAHVGPWAGRDAFRARGLGGDPDREPVPPRRWWGVEQSAWFRDAGYRPEDFRGHYVDEVTVPVGRFRIPPTELRDMLPQQLLLLEVAAEALDDAAVERDGGAGDPGAAARVRAELDRTGVYVGMALDLNTTTFQLRWALASEAPDGRALEELRDAVGPPLTADRTVGALGGIVASRVAREFRVGGPSFGVSSEEASGLGAVACAVRALREGTIVRALVGAVDLAGDVRSVLATHTADGGVCYSPTGRARPFDADADADGTLVGEGAVALVLERLSDARRRGHPVYAVIEDVASATRGAAPLGCGADAAPGLVEAAACGIPGEPGARDVGLRTARASAAALFGHTGAASGLVSLARAALALDAAVLPPAPAPRRVADDGAPGHLLVVAAPWLRNRDDGPRRALVEAAGVGGAVSAARLVEAPDAARRPPPPAVAPLAPETTGLFVVEADTRPVLLKRLIALRGFVAEQQGDTAAPGGYELARRWWARGHAEPGAALAVALLADDADEVVERTEEARRLVEGLATPPGGGARAPRVFFSGRPLGRGGGGGHDGTRGELAFLFPGSGNQYAGMGRALGLRFPQVLAAHDAATGSLRDQLVPDVLWYDRDAVPDEEALILGQVALGAFVSDVLRALEIEPDAVLGYSLGETASLFATGAFADRDAMRRRITASPLFKTELAGRCDAARRAWGLADEEEAAWSVGVVDQPETVVRRAVAEIQRAYLLIVNTPNECVVGGHPQAVEQFVERLGCHFVPVRGVTTVHCEVAEQVRDDYRDLHVFDDVEPPAGVRVYGAHAAAPYAPGADACADSLLAQALHGHDFPALVRRAYDDGVRLFVEIGPGGSCTRMIDQILGAEPHVAVAVCTPGTDEVATLLGVLARLAAERVPLDLGALYDDGRPVADGEASARPGVTLRPGGAPFERPVPTASVPADPDGELAAASVAVAPAAAPDAEPARVPATASHADTDAGDPGGGAIIRDALLTAVSDAAQARAAAHAQFLRTSAALAETMGRNAAYQQSLLTMFGDAPPASTEVQLPVATPPPARAADAAPPPALDRDQCLAFAVGRIGDVLGPEFAEIDEHPTRVRLPDEPLMLVDRILTIHGEQRSMTGGRVVTEHDIHEGAWYLDLGRIPTCIAVESGQADLFLSGWLGIDFLTKGLAVYRLLDAVVTFHAPLPTAGRTIHYEIDIEHFFQQGDTRLFRFRFDATVDGELLLTMREGCAGFFTQAELDAGEGIVHSRLDRRPLPGKHPANWRPPVPLEEEAYDEAQVGALRRGDLEGCFGERFAGLGLSEPVGLPGGRMALVDRVVAIEPQGGRYGLGLIRAELDIDPQAWFLTCHFVDDKVMPGTLMYECCLHTLRILLLRMGWVAERDGVAYEPVPGIAGRLKCRGQVIDTTKVVTYQVSLKEIGYGPEPYAVADALMYADGRPIVEMIDMSIRMAGLTEADIDRVWASQARMVEDERRPAVYDDASITAFAVGKPSEAFGDRYLPFDADRVIARLPGAPYKFLSRVTEVNHEAWQMAAGGDIEAQYDMASDEWYFTANRQDRMPFAVLLEVALQPCGWFAAYMGSALTSDEDLSFRNLGGSAVQHEPVPARDACLTTWVRCTGVSSSGGMVIQNYEYEVTSRGRRVYSGDTYFGFFTKTALANQVGMTDAAFQDVPAGEPRPVPDAAPFPDEQLRMVSHVDILDLAGGPHELGYVRGHIDVDPSAWFFAAHFHQDPVWPGSLGLEACLQLLKVLAAERWGADAGEDEGAVIDAVAPGRKHRWTYRGQVLPTDARVTVEAVVTAVDDERRLLVADGLLGVQSDLADPIRIIYDMRDFSLSIEGPA